MFNRREFLISATAVASARAWGQRPDPAILDRIAVTSGAFVPLLKGMARVGNPKATLDLMDLAGMVSERFGIHRVEFQQADFPSTEAAYLADFRAHLAKANSQASQIVLEFANINASSPDPVILLETIELTKRWIDYAAALGCPRILVNPGDLAPKTRESAIATVKTINRYAQTRKVSIAVQNRPKDAAWETLAEFVKAAGIAADPDAANFPDPQSRAAGLAALYRLTAGNSHIKPMPETPDVIRIAKEAGFKGIYTIDAAPGSGSDPGAPVQAVLDVLAANL